MKRDEVHRLWAPADSPWSPWVKPVLFAHLGENVAPRPLPPAPDWLRHTVIAPLVAAAPPADGGGPAHPYRGAAPLRDTAVIVDLPSEDGTLLGVALVDCGFRPIPLYNAVPSPLAVVELEPIMQALVDGAVRVGETPPGAAPAFLLDARRTRGSRPRSRDTFDNRSLCCEPDFPSPERLWQAGVRRALLLRETAEDPAADLQAVLFAWQRRGIQLWRKNSGDDVVARPIKVRRQALPLRIAHEVYRIMALPPRADGEIPLFPAGS